ncbi:MAG: rod shape-determining protein MreC [Planctomycetes bacterium]|jgi:rod shape-determining protein MreC|nr:rod shape-determining protein MreC [Planctomycetota bacterium]
MTGRSRTLLIIAVALGGTALAAWSGLTRFPPAVVAAAVEPVQRALSGGEADETTEQRLLRIEDQLVRVSAENALLRTRLQDYLAIRGEGGIPPEQAVVVRARIIARTVRQGRRYCELDAGAVDGVTIGMAACLGWSLVGAVVGVQEGRALVQLVSDSESRIPATLLDGEKILAEGVLTGSGKRGLLLLDYIEERDELQVTAGQRVVTAGSDGRFPPGLVLGTVTAATRSPTAGHWHVEVAPLREADIAESLLMLKFAAAPVR